MNPARLLPRPHRLAGLVLLVAVGLGSFLLLGGIPAPAQPPDTQDIHQDFRGGRRPQPPLSLFGPDGDRGITPEDPGLRVKLPILGVQRAEQAGVKWADAHLKGDFEITGTYELLSADQPRDSNVGFVLIIDGTGPKTFGKVGRFVRAVQGSIYEADFWIGSMAQNHQFAFVPTEARTGQLRLVRKGNTLYHLAADPPGAEFREIARNETPAREVASVIFAVAYNASTPRWRAAWWTCAFTPEAPGFRRLRPGCLPRYLRRASPNRPAARRGG
jgi:hypothetical protein